MNQSPQIPSFDKSIFDLSPYAKRIEKPWGYEIHWVPVDKPYMGKIEHINAGYRMSLQIHEQKQESWLIMKGRAKVVWEDKSGRIVETELEPGQGYSSTIGQKHRLVGITDCDIIEVSTPEIGTTYRLEDDYNRPDETEQQREIERS
ncbi:MAG: cupin [Candidatus Saccharimonadales bacterium]|jgi:mannose-6-phosphate isomerase-like protein (cupin superfamily)